MKYKKIRFSTLLLFIIWFTGLQAQSKLYIKEKTGVQNLLELNTIKKISFAANKMIINKSDGNLDNYSIGGICYLSFNDYSINDTTINDTIVQIKLKDSNKNNYYTLFPNPITTQLQVRYETNKAGILQIEIIDLQGKILKLQTIRSHFGQNTAIIPLTKLSKGIYMCRLHSINNYVTIKFFKN